MRIAALRAEAKSDLVNVLSRLEAHWVVLEAELVEINKDITFSEQCVQKYGYAPQIVRRRGVFMRASWVPASRNPFSGLSMN